MAVKTNLYDVLMLPIHASEEEIREAIDALHESDRGENLTALLVELEEAFASSSKRDAYNTRLLGEIEAQQQKEGWVNSFLFRRAMAKVEAEAGADKSALSSSAPKPRKKPKPPKRPKKAKKPSNTVTSSKRELPRISLNFRGILLMVLLIGAAAGALPLAEHFRASKQVEQGFAALNEAKETVDIHLQKYRSFPDAPQFSQAPFYRLELDIRQGAVKMVFTDKAAKPIAGKFLRFETYFMPNIGLRWQCRASEDFPERYYPAFCY